MKIKSTHAVPALLILISLLLAFSSLFTSKLSSENTYFVNIVCQIIIFAIPTIIYSLVMFKGKEIDLKFHPIKSNHIAILFFSLLFIVASEIAINIFLFKINPDLLSQSSIMVESNPTPEIMAYTIISYGILPALTEEILFRSIILDEYKKYGVTVSVIVSSLLFAMLHFDFAKLPTCFVTGVIFALVLYATNSIFATIIVHALHNIASIYINMYLPSLLKSTVSNLTILLIVSIVAALIALAVLFSEFSGIYTGYTYSIAVPQNSEKTPSKAKAFSEVFITPTFILFLLFYFIYTIATK